jgi:hypothetical protein
MAELVVRLRLAMRTAYGDKRSAEAAAIVSVLDQATHPDDIIALMRILLEEYGTEPVIEGIPLVPGMSLGDADYAKAAAAVAQAFASMRRKIEEENLETQIAAGLLATALYNDTGGDERIAFITLLIESGLLPYVRIPEGAFNIRSLDAGELKKYVGEVSAARQQVICYCIQRILNTQALSEEQKMLALLGYIHELPQVEQVFALEDAAKHLVSRSPEFQMMRQVAAHTLETITDRVMAAGCSCGSFSR